jgi:DNA-binding transcriptional ArsR family regulator
MAKALTDTIKDIELTEQGKNPQQRAKFIIDNERIDAIGDPTRMRIIGIFRQGIADTRTTVERDETTGDKIIREREVTRHALSIKEIVEISKSQEGQKPITQSQVYHHLPKLVEHGYVVKYGTLHKGKRTTDYYQRSAETFVFGRTPGQTDEACTNRTLESIEHMERFFGLKLSKMERDEYVQLEKKLGDISLEAYNKVVGLAKGDVTDQLLNDIFSDLVMLYAIGSDEWVKIQRRMREILFK